MGHFSYYFRPCATKPVNLDCLTHCFGQCKVELYKLRDHIGENQPNLVELYVNGNQILNDKLIEYVIPSKLTVKDNEGNILCEGYSEIDYFWGIELSKGKYNAELLITTSSGICLKYTWTFVIV